MKRFIFAIFATIVLALAATGCSDNENDIYEPKEETKTLSLESKSQFFDNNKLSFNAGSTSAEITVKSNTRWKVQILKCDGGWCESSANYGSGNGNFTIRVLENRGEERSCEVKVFKVNGEGEEIGNENEENASIIITVIQEGSEVQIAPSKVEDFPAQNPRTQTFEIVANMAWTLDVTYESSSTPHFISVEFPEQEGITTNSEESFSGEGNANFRISLQNNASNADRKGYLTLKAETYTYSVEITQQKSDFSIYVTPGEVTNIAPEGDSVNFGVLSLSDWNVASNAEWITLNRNSGTASMTEQITVTATIAPNATGTARPASIIFSPKNDNYQPIEVKIEQNAFNFTFTASPADNTLNVVDQNGATKEFSLDSRFNWEIKAPSWIDVNLDNGTASIDSRDIKIAIDANNTGVTRNGVIQIIPSTTKFGNVVEIDPKNVNVQPIQITLTQFGGEKPAVSVPWPDSYGQNEATMLFNFYSPTYEIEEAGIQWKAYSEDDNDDKNWNTLNNLDFEHGKSDTTVKAEITGLSAATKYVARGYIKYSGGIIYGVSCQPFTTAGVRPGGGDNPTPGM